MAYLGHIVSACGIATDPDKVKTVVDWPCPKCLSDVRSFLGLCSYYRRFIPDFSTVAQPLFQLLEKDFKFNWTHDCEVAFETLKSALCIAPVLAYPTLDDPYILDTDASNSGIGAILSQVQGGQERVIAYLVRRSQEVSAIIALQGESY